MNRPISDRKLLLGIGIMLVLCIAVAQILNHVKPARAQTTDVNPDEVLAPRGAPAAFTADPKPAHWGANCDASGNWCYDLHQIAGTGSIVVITHGSYGAAVIPFGTKP